MAIVRRISELSSDVCYSDLLPPADLDRQVEGRDDGEISLAAETFARESAYVFPDGMKSVGVGKAARHHHEQILLPFAGLFFILLAQALPVEAVVVRHRWNQDLTADIDRAAWRERESEYG